MKKNQLLGVAASLFDHKVGSRPISAFGLTLTEEELSKLSALVFKKVRRPGEFFHIKIKSPPCKAVSTICELPGEKRSHLIAISFLTDVRERTDEAIELLKRIIDPIFPNFKVNSLNDVKELIRRMDPKFALDEETGIYMVPFGGRLGGKDKSITLISVNLAKLSDLVVERKKKENIEDSLADLWQKS
ncbi:MAG: hypothetical protein ACFFC7_06225 [Candidatus Hermodarchaeota archaeon]